MWIIILSILFFLTSILFIFYYLKYQQIKQQKNNIENQSKELIKKLDETEKANLQLNIQNTEYKTNIKSYEETIQQQHFQIKTLEQKLETYQNQSNALKSENATYKERIQNLEQYIQNQKQEIQQIQEQLKKEFELFTKNILEQSTQKLEEKNQHHIHQIISPVKEILQQNIHQIKDIEKRIQIYYDNENKERSSLKTIIEELNKKNEEVKNTAEKLAGALTTQVKYQGDWGEFILEKLLELSGLQENIHFVTQQKNDDKQPDVTILLPNNKHIIIDSKVTLNAYIEYHSSPTNELKNQQIQNIINSVKSHIDNLSKKEYEKIYALNSIDLVLMFIPIEAIISIIQQHQPDLFNYAIRKKVLMVTPTSVLGTLKAIYFVWQQEKQRKEFEEIITEIGKLYEKIRTFTEHFLKIETAINNAQKSFEDAKKSLISGKGNAISIIEKKIKPYINPKDNIKLLTENDET